MTEPIDNVIPMRLELPPRQLLGPPARPLQFINHINIMIRQLKSSFVPYMF